MTGSRPDLDLWPPAEVVGALLAGEVRVVPAVAAVTDRIVAAAELLADRLSRPGRWLFLGAGTSGRVALGEAAELPGTFGIGPDQSLGRIAGGLDSGWGTDADEDDEEAGRADVADLGPSDVLIALAASGSTPYALAAAGEARTRGAAVVAVTTRPGSRLGAVADVAIEVEVGEEVLRGSTRMNAGTAQKIVLNVLSTTAMVRAGRVHGDLMIDVVPANLKLQARLAGIVAEIAGSDVGAAERALTACAGNARAAVLLLVGGLTPEMATTTAAVHPRLRDALSAIQT